MVLRTKTSLIVFLLFLLLHSGIIEGFKDGKNPNHFPYKDGSRMKYRKLMMMIDAVQLDYDETGANPKHEPKKKPGAGGGGGGKNP